MKKQNEFLIVNNVKIKKCLGKEILMTFVAKHKGEPMPKGVKLISNGVVLSDRTFLSFKNLKDATNLIMMLLK